MVWKTFRLLEEGGIFILFSLIRTFFPPELRGQGADLLEAGRAHHEAALHVRHAQGRLPGTSAHDRPRPVMYHFMQILVPFLILPHNLD